MRAGLRAIFAAIEPWFSLTDAVFLAGIGAVGYGIYQIDPPWAYIVVGGYFVILTTYGRLRG
jgi:hypothetical protein